MSRFSKPAEDCVTYFKRTWLWPVGKTKKASVNTWIQFRQMEIMLHWVPRSIPWPSSERRELWGNLSPETDWLPRERSWSWPPDIKKTIVNIKDDYWVIGIKLTRTMREMKSRDVARAMDSWRRRARMGCVSTRFVTIERAPRMISTARLIRKLDRNTTSSNVSTGRASMPDDLR